MKDNLNVDEVNKYTEKSHFKNYVLEICSKIFSDRNPDVVNSFYFTYFNANNDIDTKEYYDTKYIIWDYLSDWFGTLKEDQAILASHDELIERSILNDLKRLNNYLHF